MKNQIYALFAVFASCAFSRALSSPQELGKDYVIKIIEMRENSVMFEVILPKFEENREKVEHKILDSSGSTIASQQCNTGGIRYRISMSTSFIEGRKYELVIDGKYKFIFTYRETDTPSANLLKNQWLLKLLVF